jgi:hypothetical protein
MKMDMTSCCIKPSGISKSLDILGRAGVTIVDEKGEMKVNSETKMVATHFRFHDQLRGLSGSSGPSHVTYVLLVRQFVLMVLTNYLNFSDVFHVLQQQMGPRVICNLSIR